MFLIGLCGKMGVGKDYIAKHIILPHIEQSMVICFADQLKVNTMLRNNLTYKDVYVNKSAYTRQLLQLEGTENGRDKYGQDIWIRYLDNWVNVLGNRGIKNFIITDVRFKNEIDYIRSKNGVVIKIEAPLRNRNRLDKECANENVTTHRSECELDALPDSVFDYVINNDPDNLNKKGIEAFLDSRVGTRNLFPYSLVG